VSFTAHHRSFVPGPHRVAVWEPDAQGGDRAAFNATLVHAAQLAFPNARLAFVAAAAHGEAVRSFLPSEVPAGMEPVAWTPLDVKTPAALLGLRGRYVEWRRCRAWFVQARALAAEFQAELVLLASIGVPGLLAWNALRGDRDPPTVLVVHGGGGALLRSLLRWAVRVPALEIEGTAGGPPAVTAAALATELRRLAQEASRSDTTDAASKGRGA
jgi:hypothetical protein